MIPVGRIDVYAGDRNPEEEEPGVEFARCQEPNAASADVVYHPHAIQCSGEDSWMCPDCGECTGFVAEA